MDLTAFCCCQVFKIFPATERGKKGMQGKIVSCPEKMFLYEEEHFEMEEGIVNIYSITVTE